MKIGVISDTHNYLDPRVLKLFDGVEHILHGGDVGLPMILMELEAVAPVTAVLGNTDSGMDYRETEIIQLAGQKFMVHHIVDANRPSEIVQRRITHDKPDVIVFGHTHKPFNETIGGILYFNPGYAGKPRFNLPRSIAILHCDDANVRAEYISL